LELKRQGKKSARKQKFLATFARLQKKTRQTCASGNNFAASHAPKQKEIERLSNASAKRAQCHANLQRAMQKGDKTEKLWWYQDSSRDLQPRTP
jgi:phage major head subunit gpT-like protein